jgi:protein involved in polysaccharide export with SLBB domain
LNTKPAAPLAENSTDTSGGPTGGTTASTTESSSGAPANGSDRLTSTPANNTDSSTPEANAAASEFALTKLYRVGPGDVLDVRVNDSQAPQSTLFTITPAGLLEHPMLAEPMHVIGMSVEEIGTAIEADLKRRALLDTPKVSVGVRDYASHTILVSGLVKDSGTKILRREAIPLYVVVADAQPLPEAAKVTVVRSESNETFEADLNQPTEMNILVRPGDVITLSANVTQFLYIGGEVKSPGEKTYRRGLTLTQAIISAGGVTNKAKEARLGRDDGHGFLTVTRFKLKEIESGKIADPLVRPGDRVMIVE